MSILELLAVFLTLAAVLSWFNCRFIGLPPTIGVMSAALVISIAMIVLDLVGFALPRAYDESLLHSVDFSEVLMQGMLSVLLFAGALQVDLSKLKAYAWQVALLAFGGTAAATFLVGFGIWYVLPLFGMTLPLAYCLVFGALISPTDPISVTGILRSAGAPKNLETVITAESLFNDGIAVVLFALMVEMLVRQEQPSLSHVAALLLREAGGGIGFGLVLGLTTYRMLKSINSYQEEVLVTLAAVVGGYVLANRLHISGPLTMVTAGIILGNHARESAMSTKTREHVDTFWELLDSIFNAVLFVLIGLEAAAISYAHGLLWAGMAAILIALAARFVTVGLPIGLLRNIVRLPQGSWQVLTWGGLRGGISVALALSLPPGDGRNTVVAMTYIVVVFTVLVQGLTIGRVVRRVVPCAN